MELLAIIILGILGMPFFGIYLMVSGDQKANRGLGLAVFIIGIMIWGIIKH